MTVKYTKTELRSQQVKLTQLLKYLPTLQLKKAMLQMEVSEISGVLEHLYKKFSSMRDKIESYAPLLSDEEAAPLFRNLEILEVKKHYENIAGVDIPVLENVVFDDSPYFLFDTPVWLESAKEHLQDFINMREEIEVAAEKKERLEKELREVSIRVNLFEKIMIPRTKGNIKRIKIFLGDQELAAVSQAKVSKRKIEERKAIENEALA